jgi:DNA-binding CsgD family transcriptional regulator
VGIEIEILSAHRRMCVELPSDRATVGNSNDNDIVLSDDAAVSQLHALFERFPAGWCVTDLGSSNGTWLNGERLWAARRIRHGDEIRVGRTRLVFRDWTNTGRPPTEVEDAAPPLTKRERDVLIALCRPLLGRDMFTQPETTKAIAAELVVSEAAVKQHMVNLYAKFDVSIDDPARRARLANEAIRRGSVSIADLSAADDA